MPSFVTPKKNAAFECYIALVSQANTKVFQQSPTLAAGDVTVSIDNGAPADIATLPVIGTNPALVKVNLSADEMNGDNISVVFSDVADAEWCDFLLNIQTAERQVDDLAFPATPGRSIAVDVAGVVDASAVLGPTAAGEIVDAILDEPISGHAAAGSVGLTLSAAASNAVGSGAITWPYTVTEAGTGLPIPEVNVWVTSDVDGLNVLASGFTNAGGIVTFYLDAGVAYFWCKKSGMNFANPDMETVS